MFHGVVQIYSAIPRNGCMLFQDALRLCVIYAAFVMLRVAMQTSQRQRSRSKTKKRQKQEKSDPKQGTDAEDSQNHICKQRMIS